LWRSNQLNLKGLSMNRKLLVAVGLIAASSAFADDVDLVPNGYVSSVIRAAQSNPIERAAAAPASISEAGVKPSDASPAKTRAQLVAETREAARLGLLKVGEDGIAVNVTPEQLHQIEQAGLQAVAIQSAQSSAK
jgi:4-hydroxyphenylpyruvate dioxygenase-like putative hemolysin